MTIKTRFATLAALALATACAAGTASAATSESAMPSKTVRYGDLDLTTEAGARALYQRIALVARQVCPDGDARDLSRLVRARTCQKEAVERAVAAVNNPHLALAAAKATRKG